MIETIGEGARVIHVCGRTKFERYELYMFLYMVYMYMCVYVCVRGFGAHTGHGSRGLTLSILLNGKPICEHFSSQRSRRLILEWVGLIHRLPPPGFAFTTISIAINVSVPSSSADWRGRIHDSCVGLACTTRPYTCYHSREIHMDAPSVHAWSARTRIGVLCQTDARKGSRPSMNLFSVFWKMLWMF